MFMNACWRRIPVGMIGDCAHNVGSTSTGRYATMREYEFQRSVRVRTPTSNKSFTIIGVKPYGVARLAGIRIASTITANNGRRHTDRALSSRRSDGVAPLEKATAA